MLVVEEIFGVHEYIKDTCRRLAKLGYCAVTAELYARIADLSKMTDAAVIVRDVISKAPDATVMTDLDALAAWAAANGGDPNRLGITGFCRGGRAVWLYDAHNPRLKAAVAWYGPVGGAPSDIQPKSADDIATVCTRPCSACMARRTPASHPLTSRQPPRRHGPRALRWRSWNIPTPPTPSMPTTAPATSATPRRTGGIGCWPGSANTVWPSNRPLLRALCS